MKKLILVQLMLASGIIQAADSTYIYRMERTALQADSSPTNGNGGDNGNGTPTVPTAPPTCGANFGECEDGNSTGYTSNIGANTVSWNCNNIVGSTPCSIPATLGINGECGSSNGQLFELTPTDNLCNTNYGTSSVTLFTGQNYLWECTGEPGTQTKSTGITSQCNAFKELTCTNGQVLAEFFNNTDLTGSPVTTKYPTSINYNWGYGAESGVNGDGFSLRITGYFEAPATGNYIFRVNSDDGVRLRFNGNLVINDWNTHGSTDNDSTIISLSAGAKYQFILEYFDLSGPANLNMRYSFNGGAFNSIPASRLNNCN